ncbi:hypothetical protein DFH09DRAFT_1107643 [Mycena vulgaris]|nr:hypothetical protein DFH09DRAFT_1107643 [Mycena vulgaris]
MNFGVADSASSRAEARARISALEARISYHELALRARRDECEALQDQLNSYVYPVLTLPNEIVSEIFSHFIYPESPPLVGIFSSLMLEQICHTSCEIAVSTSSLWPAIRLDLGAQSTIDHATQLRLTETWLDLSRVFPLSIALAWNARARDAAMQPTLAALFAHSFRWEKMDMCIPFSDIVSFSVRTMPLLHIVTVDPTDQYWGFSIALFGTVPNLTNALIPEPWFSPNPGVTVAVWISLSGCGLEQLHITHSVESELYYRKALLTVQNISTDCVPAPDDGDSD